MKSTLTAPFALYSSQHTAQLEQLERLDRIKVILRLFQLFLSFATGIAGVYIQAYSGRVYFILFLCVWTFLYVLGCLMAFVYYQELKRIWIKVTKRSRLPRAWIEPCKWMGCMEIGMMWIWFAGACALGEYKVRHLPVNMNNVAWILTTVLSFIIMLSFMTTTLVAYKQWRWMHKSQDILIVPPLSHGSTSCDMMQRTSDMIRSTSDMIQPLPCAYIYGESIVSLYSLPHFTE